MNSLSSSLTPLIYNTYRKEQTPFELARIFRLLVAGTLLMLLALSIFATEILHLMTTPNYYSAAIIIPFLALSAALSGFYIFTPGLFIANDTWLISVINVASGLLNLGLNYVLIPALGLTGAALATCLALSLNLAVSLFFSQRRYHIPIQWDRVGWGGLISIVILYIGMSFHTVEVRVIVIKSLLLFVVATLFMMVRLVERYEVSGLLELIYSRVMSLLPGAK
jgi:O-antigen/teichoic acid export membrane protein